MEDKRRLPVQLRGIKVMNGREYVWLLDSKGIPHKHFLTQYRIEKTETRSKTERRKDTS